MHNNKDPDYNRIRINDNVTQANLTANQQEPQLTPTGKISHAKTRVYTQRYRKAWEQMPDFKGWLTSVPHQPTRAYCTYCKKNLHAHRLSLLKHTCTMKHQRGALMHEKEAANAKVDKKNHQNQIENDREISKQLNDEDDPVVEEEEEDEEFKLEDVDGEDDDDENIEYVVERLDDDDIDDDDDDQQLKDIDDDQYADEEDDEENLPLSKKLKSEDDQSGNRPDTLAEAMAHVHGEYLDVNGDPVNVELEMVVESVDQSDQEIRIVSVRSERDEEEDNQHRIAIENYHDNEDNSNDFNLRDHENEKENDHDNNHPVDQIGTTASSCKSSVLGESSDGASEIDDTDSMLNRNALVNPGPSRRNFFTRSASGGAAGRTINVLPAAVTSVNNGPAASNVSGVKKTITITSGGKTVTIDPSAITTYVGDTRYSINTKRQDSTIVVKADKRIVQSPKNDSQTKIQQQHQISANTSNSYSNPGTSQPASRKHIVLKSVKPTVVKKPCISTHVLDTSKGVPVGGLQISLYKLMDGRWTFLNESTTTTDGRCGDLIDTTKYTFTSGRYKLHFDVDKYFTLRRIETIYPFIEIIFDVKNQNEHYHIPVLISPFGYTTYRGS